MRMGRTGGHTTRARTRIRPIILQCSVLLLCLCACGLAEGTDSATTGGNVASPTKQPTLIVVTPSYAADATSVAPGPVGIIDCGGNFVVRPSSITFACGDGNELVTNMVWARWDQSEATGKGIQQSNECVPTCAAGQLVNSPVSVRLLGPRATPGQPTEHFHEAIITSDSNGASNVIELDDVG